MELFCYETELHSACVTKGHSSKLLLFYLSRKVSPFSILMFDNWVFSSNHMALQKSLFIMTKPEHWLELSGNTVKYYLVTYRVVTLSNIKHWHLFEDIVKTQKVNKANAFSGVIKLSVIKPKHISTHILKLLCIILTGENLLSLHRHFKRKEKKSNQKLNLYFFIFTFNSRAA